MTEPNTTRSVVYPEMPFWLNSVYVYMYTWAITFFQLTSFSKWKTARRTKRRQILFGLMKKTNKSHWIMGSDKAAWGSSTIINQQIVILTPQMYTEKQTLRVNRQLTFWSIISHALIQFYLNCILCIYRTMNELPKRRKKHLYDFFFLRVHIMSLPGRVFK